MNTTDHFADHALRDAELAANALLRPTGRCELGHNDGVHAHSIRPVASTTILTAALRVPVVVIVCACAKKKMPIRSHTERCIAAVQNAKVCGKLAILQLIGVAVCKDAFALFGTEKAIAADEFRSSPQPASFSLFHLAPKATDRILRWDNKFPSLQGALPADLAVAASDTWLSACAKSHSRDFNTDSN